MSSVIRPESHHPVIGHTITGPAAPTPAEDRLRAEFEKLRLEFAVVLTDVQVAHSKIEKMENDWCFRLATWEKECYARMSTLEARWYERVARWFRKVFRCQ